MNRILLPLAALSAIATAAAQETTSNRAADAVGFHRDRYVWLGSDQDNPIIAQVSAGAQQQPCPANVERPWAEVQPGERVMFGATWACFDTFTDLRIASGRLPTGSYLLALGRTTTGFELLWFDAEETLSRPKQALAELRPVFRAPLAEVDAQAAAPHLHFDLAAIGRVAETATDEHNRVQLDITFGKQALTLPIEVTGTGGQRVTLDDPRGTSIWQIDDARSVTVEYGSPPWSKKTAAAIADPKGGFHWRLGQNWWTCLRTTCRLRIGSEKLPPGNYHLAMRIVSPDKVELLVSNARSDAEKKVDSAFSKLSTALLTVPLACEASDKENRQQALHIGFAETGAHTQLMIRFGPHTYSVPVTHR